MDQGGSHFAAGNGGRGGGSPGSAGSAGGDTGPAEAGADGSQAGGARNTGGENAGGEAPSDVGPLAWVRGAQQAYDERADAIDLTGDGKPDWFLSWNAAEKLPQRESLDANSNGIPEWTLTRSGTTTTIVEDRNEDTLPDVVRVDTIDAGLTTSVSTTYAAGVPLRRITLQQLGTPSSVEQTIEHYDPAQQSFAVDRSVVVPAGYDQSTSNGPPVSVGSACDEQARQRLQDAEGDAITNGGNCLHDSNFILGELLTMRLATGALTITCDTSLPSCGRSFYATGEIRLNPNQPVSACGNLDSTLFHELLHMVLTADIFPIDEHNARPGVNDEIWGCEIWCFGEDAEHGPGTDLCRRHQCMNNECGDTECSDQCDKDSGSCLEPPQLNTAPYEGLDCRLEAGGCDPWTCKQGRCEEGSPLADGSECRGGTCCAASCVDTGADSANCGACGNNCGPQGACVASNCDCGTTISGRVKCDGSCVDTQTDPLNCGACGNDCGSEGSCSSGTCDCSTGLTGLVACNGTCVDTQTDPENCGACGVPCTGESCIGGQCSCANWNIAGEWTTTQSNGFAVVFNFTQAGTSIGGSAVVSGAGTTGTVQGTLVGEQLSVTVTWSAGNAGNYAAVIASGTLTGTTQDTRGGPVVSWTGTGPESCAP
jgi:hypothetical protein